MKTKRNHRKLFVLSAIMLFGFMNLSAQTLTKTFTFNFDAKNVVVEQWGDNGECEIFYNNWSSDSGILGEPSNTYMSYNILIPDNYRILDFTYSAGSDTCRINRIVSVFGDTLVVDSIDLFTVSGPSTGSNIDKVNVDKEKSDSLPTIFPAKVLSTGSVIKGGYQIAVFKVSPFTYYTTEKKLSMSTTVNLIITIEYSNNGNPTHNSRDEERIKNSLYNPEDFGKDTENWTPVSTGIAEECVTKTRVQTANSKLLCTAPDAVKMEVYTMDAVKVGEAHFTDGQAEVKVSNTPATYLYIVTYPNGRRESGKIAVKGDRSHS